VVTFDDILDAADQGIDQFEKLAHSRVSHPKRKRLAMSGLSERNTLKHKQPIFSDESSETKYTSDSESGLSIYSPTFFETTDSTTNGYVVIHDVVSHSPEIRLRL